MLKRVSIQNFKSLKDVTLDLQKVNLLIGPNNSGKTNFLKALEFIQYEETEILENKDRLVFDRNTEQAIVIKLILSNDERTFNDEQILEEVFEVDTSSWNKYKKHYYNILENEKRFDPFGSFESNKATRLGRYAVYKPDSNLITKTASLADDDKLNADCSNLVPYIFNLSQNYKKLFNQLESELGKCVGDLIGVGTPAVSTSSGNQLRLKFFNNKGLDFWADEVSEGVLYFLALLCIISQPNPPKLLLLEEPEKGIHPRRIREVMDFVFRLAEEKDIQIILTTHNENVLNEFTSMPEAVFVFSKDEEGATHVKNLQTGIIEPSHQRSRETGTKEIDFTSNLGENWMYGLLGGVPEEIL